MRALVFSVCFLICLHEGKLQDADDSSQDIFTMLSTLNCIQFKKLIIAAGSQTDDFYMRSPSLTVFVPNDTAFDQMLPVRRQRITAMSPAEKENYVKSFTLPKMLYTSSMNSNFMEDSLGVPAATRIFFNRRNNRNKEHNIASGINGSTSVYANGALISNPDIRALNGIIHIIDRVLEPIIPSKIFGYVRQPNPATPSFSLKFFTDITKYVAGAYYSSTISPLQTTQPMTLFVPTDDAISKIPVGKLEQLRSNQPLLSRVIKQHVIRDRTVYTSFVENNEAYDCMYGRAVFRKTGESVYVSAGGVRAEITQGNLTLSNGVIHYVDSVLGFVYINAREQIQQDARLSKFNQMLTRGHSDIQNFLIQPAGVTVFVPVNEAFEAIKGLPGADILNNQTSDDFILHLHLLETGMPLDVTNVNSDYESRLEARTQYKGWNVKIYTQGNDLWVECGYVKARVIRPDVGVTNGFVHYVDAVFGVPPRDVPRIIYCEDSLIQSSHLFEFTGLNDFLKDVRIHKPLRPCQSDRHAHYNYTQYTHSDNGNKSSCNVTTSQTSYTLLRDRCRDSNELCHFTVFVPNGTAVDDFKKMSYGQELFTHKDKLRHVLLRHIVSNRTIYIDQLSPGQHDYVSATGDVVGLLKTSEYYTEVIFRSVRARVIHSDLGATNGVIHIIDDFLFISEDLTQNTCNNTGIGHIVTTDATPSGQIQITPVHVSLFKDATFRTSFIDSRDKPQIGQPIYVQVAAPSNDSLIMILNSCHANFTLNTVDSFSHLLISHGCPVGKDTQILASRNQETRFKFDILNLPHHSNGIKITCDVTFCSKTDFSPHCQLGCHSNQHPGIIGK